ncbi:S1C family serine protease [Mariniblastus fucicola]|uniref:Serine endoprotease DegS n=1 Tax=Mariniblastus fucicola TaxID=980251 RepID=A0A5B9P410_9BACT|nr:trypsin-like peptidase domain-containing protein [Mariniblastus fucicola]QEG21347.1 Serine endoprotease DegS [Mariniblastus fucicola]
MSVANQPTHDPEEPVQPVVVPDSESVRETPESGSPQVAPVASGEPSFFSLLFLMASILFLAAWFVGPRLVEEYQYASTKGKLRAEYENAVTILEGHPLKKVSMASRLVAQKVKPSVVSIRTRKIGEDDGLGFRRGWDSADVMEGFGSGVIMDKEGYIVTNAHVIDNSESIWVELHDRRKYEAIEVGRDEISDIAVLKISADGLIPAQWGDSEELEVGSIVWAVGSPYRYEQTVTSGIISAKDRIGDPNGRVKNLLQTDAAVNPGNSGGPLVDSDGNVVGINASIYGKTFQGISFAVPSATARFVYEQLLESGKVVRGFLGVQPYKVSHQYAERFGLPDLKGALLVRVEPGSPAHNAGLRRNDVVRLWNDSPVHNYNNLYRLTERTQPGSIVEVSLIRNGEPHLATVTIGQAPMMQSGISIEAEKLLDQR